MKRGHEDPIDRAYRNLFYGLDHGERVARLAAERANENPSRQVRRAEARARQKVDRR